MQNAEVREKIIKVAIEEFAVNGYKAASTNSLCKNANVSKGLIYYYFKTKEETYLSALRYVIDKVKENVIISLEDNDKSGRDYISEFFHVKFKFFRENPLYSKLIINAILDDTIEEAKKIAEELSNHNNRVLYEIIKKIDINPKFDKDKAFELVVMIGEKLEEKYLKLSNSKNGDDIIDEFRQDHKLMIEIIFEGLEIK